MVDFKKGAVITAITILFTVFIFSLAYAIKESPQYDTYCDRFAPLPAKPYYDANHSCPEINLSSEEQIACDQQDGYMEGKYDTNGCTVSYFCNTCNAEYQTKQKSYQLYLFLFSGIFGLLAIIFGLLIPRQKTVTDILSTGFLFGGLLTLLVGTLVFFADISSKLRPIIILLELGLIILIAFKYFKK